MPVAHVGVSVRLVETHVGPQGFLNINMLV